MKVLALLNLLTSKLTCMDKENPLYWLTETRTCPCMFKKVKTGSSCLTSYIFRSPVTFLWHVFVLLTLRHLRTLHCLVNVALSCERCAVLWTLRSLVNLVPSCERCAVMWSLHCLVIIVMPCTHYVAMWHLWTLGSLVAIALPCEHCTALWTLRRLVAIALPCLVNMALQRQHRTSLVNAPQPWRKLQCFV